MEVVIDAFSLTLLLAAFLPLLYIYSRSNGHRPLVRGILGMIFFTGINIIWSIGDSSEPIRYKIVRDLALASILIGTIRVIKSDKKKAGAEYARQGRKEESAET